MKDYYQVLNLNKNCTAKEIKSAFRRLSKQFHPDLNDSPDAEPKFIEIYEAYQILIDSSKRKKYDDLRSKQKNQSIVRYQKKRKESEQKFQEWSAQARREGYQYSRMNFKNFAKQVFDVLEEVSILVLYSFLSFLETFAAGATSVVALMIPGMKKLYPLLFVNIIASVYLWYLLIKLKEREGFNSYLMYVWFAHNKNSRLVRTTGFLWLYMILFSVITLAVLS